MKNLEMFEMSFEEMNNIKGGGDPVPGAEIYIEQEPNDEPVANDGGTAGVVIPGGSVVSGALSGARG